MKGLSRKYFYFLAILTGVLLSAGWPSHGLPLFLLFAFFPLLLIEANLKSVSVSPRKPIYSFFWYAYIAMLTWNALTTWWVCNSTVAGGIIAVVCNSFFMAVVLLLFHITKRRAGVTAGYASLPIYWLAFEYIHLNWQLSWPWLTLGFGFANYATLMQWYRFTGPLGGSLWILLCNIAIFNLLSKQESKLGVTRRTKLNLTTLVIIIPIALSVIMFNAPDDSLGKKAVNVVVVQPNIDPYNEKFSGDYTEQLKKMLILADEKVDSNTDYLIFPETALTDPNIWENNLLENTSIEIIRDYLQKHPNLCIVTGAATYKAYLHGDKPTETARKFTSDDGYYDAYNTALQLDSSKNIQVYHKSKLVPGVEFMPFAKLLAPLAKLAFDLGGTSGTLGIQKEPSVFYSGHAKTTIAPAICYESIYGAYIGEYVMKGAQLIFVITNDGWWKDTPGYRQHFSYGAMLAAETGKELVQCANTGISGIIDNKGNILQRTAWWVPAVIKAKVYPSDAITFYDRHGDYPGYYACILSSIFIIFLIIQKIGIIFRRK